MYGTQGRERAGCWLSLISHTQGVDGWIAHMETQGRMAEQFALIRLNN